MFHIRIAGVVVGIDNRYEYIERLCQDYTVSGETPAFTVRAEEQEIDQETAASLEPQPVEDRGYYESSCLCRQICLGMVEYDGFLMHSAVLNVKDRALAFAAKSGTGKSTHVGMWRERYGEKVLIINGDKPVYRFVDGVLYACGTPWRGKEGWGYNTMVPLKALCFLERGTENRLERISKAEAIPLLFHQVLLPKEPELMGRFLDLVDRMLAAVPCYRLRCLADWAAVEVAQRGLMGGKTT